MKGCSSWYQSLTLVVRLHAPPVAGVLAAQCFLGCLCGVSLVYGLRELLLPPLQADLLRQLRLSFPPRGEGLAILLQPPKAHDQVLGCPPRELVWLPTHQGLTSLAIRVIVDTVALAPSGGLGRPPVLEPACLR